MHTPIPQNFAQKFRWYAHFSSFSSKFSKFQILLEQSIFVVQERLVYKKASIFNGKCDEIKIKRFA